MPSEDQVNDFLNSVVFVVTKVFSNEELVRYRSALIRTLSQRGVDIACLVECAKATHALSSTNGSGGVLDEFYEDWKMELAKSRSEWRRRCWRRHTAMTAKTKEQAGGRSAWHLYRPFNPKEVFAYLNWIGFCVLAEVSEWLGERIHGRAPRRKRSAPCRDCWCRTSTAAWIICSLRPTPSGGWYNALFHGLKMQSQILEVLRLQGAPTVISNNGRIRARRASLCKRKKTDPSQRFYFLLSELKITHIFDQLDINSIGNIWFEHSNASCCDFGPRYSWHQKSM